MKIAFLDKDGTLVKPIAGEIFSQSPTDQMLLPGVAERAAEMNADGWELVIVSNQGGVATNKKSLEDAIAEVIFAMELLDIHHAMLAHSYEVEYGEAVWVDLTGDLPFHQVVTNAKRRFRKPHDGMIDYVATTAYGSRLWKDEIKTVMIGDRPEDAQCAANAGVRFIDAKQWRETAWKP